MQFSSPMLSRRSTNSDGSSSPGIVDAGVSIPPFQRIHDVVVARRSFLLGDVVRSIVRRLRQVARFLC
jgi:hypothetical protein